MINILPTEGRATAKRVYVFRLVKVATFGGAFVALCAAALLFPSYLVTSAAAQTAHAEASRLDAAKQQTGKSMEAPITLAKAEIAAFGPLRDTPLPSDSIEAVLQARLTGITITSIQYEIKGPRVVVVGAASTREKLLAFEQSLRKTPGVSSVDLPVSALAKNEDAHFQISVSFQKSVSLPPTTIQSATTSQ